MSRETFRSAVIGALVGFVIGLWIIQCKHRSDLDNLTARVLRLETRVFSISRLIGEAR